MKKLYISFLLFCLPQISWGQIVVIEIMYDLSGTDTGREWIEIKNIGQESIDISDWKLFEANVNHKLVPVTTGLLAPNGFGIIVDSFEKWSADYPNFNGLVFDSAFSLSNTGETLVIRNESSVDVDTVSYTSDMGAQGDGNTLQKTSAGVFVSAPPTLGSDTTASQSVSSSLVNDVDEDKNTRESETDTIQTDKLSTHSSQAVANVSFDAPELIVTSGRSRIGFVGTPLHFEAKIKSMKEIPAGNAASHVWSMGDGSSRSGQFISHTYEYAGDYIVILNSSMGGADAVSKVKVKIIEPHISITNVSLKHMEIMNNDTHEINLGGWSIVSGTSRGVIPQDTIISPRAKVSIPFAHLGLRDVRDKFIVQNPLGESVASTEIITSAYNPEQNPEQPIVTLPEGMTLDSLRMSLQTALDQHNHVQPAKSRIAHDASQIVEDRVATSTQTASVIYSVSHNQEINWWQKVKNIFKK